MRIRYPKNWQDNWEYDGSEEERLKEADPLPSFDELFVNGRKRRVHYSDYDSSNNEDDEW